ncbi:MAG TPA: Calx-beta domain-containing protein [Pyrinomonadaceae bacterium]|nr:Calx-beta domain-containing protein [Pyrinomonadaceae bacterium]
MIHYKSKCLSFLAAILLLFISASVTSSVIFAQSTADPNIRISQVYTRGGEAGAAFQNDFVELFNRGQTDVDVSGWSLNISNFAGAPPNFQISSTNIRFFSSPNLIMKPGGHLLIKFGFSGSGQPLPTPDINLSPFPLSEVGAQIILLPKDKTLPFHYCPAAPDLTGTVVDYVGFGIATCYEGTVAPAPLPDKALSRQADGCIDTDDNFADLTLATPNPRNRLNGLTPCGNPGSSVIEFGAPQFEVVENQGVAQVMVTRTGDVSTAATVDYLVLDNIPSNSASERSDYTTKLGTLHFAPGEIQKNVDLLVTDNLVPEADEHASLGLLNATGNAGIGPRNSALLVIHDDIHDSDSGESSNVIDTSSGYVRQHYHDFLNRQADSGGEAFWINNIESCGNSVACREVKRLDTSAAFFLSIEFQRTGFLVYRVYKASLPETSERPRAMPRYREFMRDTQQVAEGVAVGSSDWEQTLEANVVRFTEDFVYRPEFLAVYPPSLNQVAYVEKLNVQAGNVLTFMEFFELSNRLMAGLETRGSVLRKIAEKQNFSDREKNRAFVLMQYYGYLRRNPDDLPDTDFGGFDFWLAKMNQFGGDYRAAEMVKAFITSDEYRRRFAP